MRRSGSFKPRGLASPLMNVAASLLILVSACASAPALVPSPLEPGLADAVRRALAAADRGDPGTTALVSSILAEHPDQVDARRLRQNLRFAAGESWEIHEDARARWKADPESPAELYLLARTVPDRGRQAEMFRRCTELDPQFYHGHYGLAVALLELGDAEGSIEAGERALRIRPGDPDSRLVLAVALEKDGRPEEARSAFLSLLETESDRPSIVGAAAEHLYRSGEHERALDALLAGLERAPASPALLLTAIRMLPDARVGPESLRAVAAAAGRSAAARATSGYSLALRGLARMRLSEPAAALADFDAALALGVSPVRLREGMIECAVLAGRYRRASRLWRESLPIGFLDEVGNLRWPAIRRLFDAFESAAEGPTHPRTVDPRTVDPRTVDPRTVDPRTMADLARALSGAGFDALAAEVALGASRRAPGDPALQELKAGLEAWHCFVEEVREVLRAGYEGHRRKEEGDELDGVIATLGVSSRRILGRDVVEGIPVRSFPFVGSVLRSDHPDAPEIWAEHGSLLVLGRRSGGPVEATLLRLVGQVRGLEEDGASYDLAVGEGQTLRSYGEQLSGRIAGFTLPGWVLLNLDVVNRWEARIRALADRARPAALWPAPDAERRLSLWFPADLTGRLARVHMKELRSDDRPLSVLSTLTHELGHVVDLDGYFPLLTGFPEALVTLVGAGFSSSRVAVELEKTAESWALLKSPSPRNALLNTVGYLPHARRSPPHSVAYYELVEELVAELDEHPERYPSVDRGYNLLEQLDRLTDEELRDLIDRAID